MPIQAQGLPSLFVNIFAQFHSWYVKHRRQVAKQTAAAAAGEVLLPNQSFRHQHTLLFLPPDCTVGLASSCLIASKD